MRARAGAALGVLASLAAVAAPAGAAALPTVASINVCADQLVLALAAPEQVLSLSWLAADPQESLRAEQAASYPLNYGSAEELLRLAPDLVVAGAFTTDYTRGLLGRLGERIVVLRPATSFAEIETNVRMLADALEQSARGEALIEAMRARILALRARRPAKAVDAVVVRPGGFTVGAGSLADRLMRLAGLRNVAAAEGLDRWGSLSMETLLRAAPQLIVVTAYRPDEPSLANAVLEHPALASLEARVPTVTVPAKLWACGLPASLDAADLLVDGRERLSR